MGNLTEPTFVYNGTDTLSLCQSWGGGWEPGSGPGDTPVADSYQCMAKPTPIYCKAISLQLK